MKYDEAALQKLLTDRCRPILIAELDDTVAGYAFCVIKVTENNPVLADGKSLYVDDLCVEETCRGQGIASKLYAHVCDYARSIGCRSVTLNVWCGNDNAMRFYESRGMKPRKIYMEASLEE